MAIYTDGIHLLGDTEEELHEFAGAIGLTPQWFNNHKHKYYDVIGDKVEKAIISGAIFKTARELVVISNKANCKVVYLPISSL